MQVKHAMPPGFHEDAVLNFVIALKVQFLKVPGSYVIYTWSHKDWFIHS